jgi:hypothetical protein
MTRTFFHQNSAAWWLVKSPSLDVNNEYQPLIELYKARRGGWK